MQLKVQNSMKIIVLPVNTGSFLDPTKERILLKGRNQDRPQIQRYENSSNITNASVVKITK